MSKQPSSRTPRGVATSWQEVSRILDWLEVEKNFKLITGSAQADAKGVQAGLKLKKADGYVQLADFVNAKFQKKWNGKIAGSRYRALLKKYKATRRAYTDVSGEKFGLTAEEIAKGITVEDKLERTCYAYRRWENLFGSRQNVDPSYVFEGGIDSDDDENDEEDEQFEEDQEEGWPEGGLYGLQEILNEQEEGPQLQQNSVEVFLLIRLSLPISPLKLVLRLLRHP